jgi:hypothetical protein
VKPGDYEIRCNDDGTLDEIVACRPAFFHLEQMDAGHWWLRIDLPGAMGGAIDVELYTNGASIFAKVEEE